MKFLQLIFLFISGLCFSQLGYIINVKTYNMVDETLYLSLYSGNTKNTFKIDSAKITKANQVINFSQKNGILPLILQISTQKSKQKVDVAVDNGTVLTLDVKNNLLLSAVTQNAKNKDFLRYQNSDIEAKKTLAKSLLKKYPLSTSLGLYSLLEERRLHQFDYQKTGNYSEFLRGLDLKDKRLKLLPNFYTFLNSYFNLKEINNENYQKAADILLKGQNCNQPNFSFLFNWILSNLQLHESKRLGKTYEYIFNTYLNNENCIKKEPNLYHFAHTKMLSYDKISIGDTLEDVEIQTLEGKKLNLSSYKTPIFMMFYDPNCSHCIEMTPKVKSFLSILESKLNINIKKIAFYNVADEKDWQSFVTKFGIESWENVKISDKTKDYQKLLNVYANPVYYIVDENLKLVLKDYNESQIEHYFSNRK